MINERFLLIRKMIRSVTLIHETIQTVNFWSIAPLVFRLIRAIMEAPGAAFVEGGYECLHKPKLEQQLLGLPHLIGSP